MPDPSAVVSFPDILQEGELDALRLQPYSDGRIWDERQVAREIGHYLEVSLDATWQIGRRLIWAKAQLPHGRFQEWTSASFGLGERSVRNYMQAAEFLTENPALRKPLSRAGLKKTLLLATLSPDQVERLLLTPEGEIEELDKVPYVELRRQVDQLRSRCGETEDQLATTEERLQVRSEELLVATRLSRTSDEKAVAADLDKRLAEVEKQILLLGGLMDQVAGRYGEFGSALRARLLGSTEYVVRLAQVEQLRLRERVGEEVWGADWAALSDDPRPAASVLPLPQGRLPGVR